MIFLFSLNKEELDEKIVIKYNDPFNKLNLENLNFYASISYNNLSERFADISYNYINFNLLYQKEIFIPIFNNTNLFFKLPNLILDFNFVFKTSLINNWDLNTMIINFFL